MGTCGGPVYKHQHFRCKSCYDGDVLMMTNDRYKTGPCQTGYNTAWPFKIRDSGQAESKAFCFPNAIMGLQVQQLCTKVSRNSPSRLGRFEWENPATGIGFAQCVGFKRVISTSCHSGRSSRI